MEPLISIRILRANRQFYPGEELECMYQVDAVDAVDIQALEASVLWHTEGKGDEDLSVHHFDRLLPSDAPEGDLRTQRRLTTRLPNCPLSYAGVTVKIRWCVRVRVFLRRGKEAFFERTFVLGDLPKVDPPRRARSVSSPTQSDDDGTSADT